jgi:hypothetical protein
VTLQLLRLGLDVSLRLGIRAPAAEAAALITDYVQ